MQGVASVHMMQPYYILQKNMRPVAQSAPRPAGCSGIISENQPCAHIIDQSRTERVPWDNITLGLLAHRTPISLALILMTGDG